MLSLSSTQIRVIRKQIGQKMNFSGKIVIMTGASRGIGAASAKEFAQKGAIVILTAQDEQKLAHVAREIGSAARVHVLNIAKPEQVEKMISQTLNEFGKIDIVVNNAGRIKPIQRLLDIKIGLEQYHRCELKRRFLRFQISNSFHVKERWWNLPYFEFWRRS